MNPDKSANASPYFPYFDWLRFILAATVMLGHDKVLPWDRASTFAVHVFFALSGWLIGGILMDMRTKDLPRFFYNRALRIWVPYYVACVLLIAVSVLKKDVISTPWLELVSFKLLMVYNIFSYRHLAAGYGDAPLMGSGHHFWSVNAEEQFYLIAALLLVSLWRFGGRHVLVWLAITVTLLMFSGDYPGLSLGVLAALAFKHRPWHRTVLGQSTLVAVVLLGLPFLFHAGTFALASPFVSTAIVLLLAVPGAQSRVGEVLGGLSYPLYLNHWIGVYASKLLFKQLHIVDALATRQALAAGVSVLIGLAHYWWIDRIVRERRNGWYTAQRGVGLMVAAYAIFAVGLAYGFWLMR